MYACSAIGVLYLIALALPWWEGALPLGLETHAPKGLLVGAVLLLVAGAMSRGRKPDPLPIALSVIVTGASLVAFHGRVVRNEFFPDTPFLANVEAGFYVACFVWVLNLAILFVVVEARHETRRT